MEESQTMPSTGHSGRSRTPSWRNRKPEGEGASTGNGAMDPAPYVPPTPAVDFDNEPFNVGRGLVPDPEAESVDPPSGQEGLGEPRREDISLAGDEPPGYYPRQEHGLGGGSRTSGARTQGAP